MTVAKPKAVWMMLVLSWMSCLPFGCTDGQRKSACRDPIDEKHRGLQWLSRGPLGQHLAIDFVADEGTEVRAIADGRVEHNYREMGDYGGCDGTPGPVLITRHSGGTNTSFAVQYGHVASHLEDGESISAGDVIGRVIDYIPCCDSPEGCPHLHFAIWDAPTEHPTSGMGYGTPRSFVDPDWFFENDLCLPAGEAGAGAR
jgi:murein DD-endopeptidase MepM/ murein hydrolase activator NlpD